MSAATTSTQVHGVAPDPAGFSCAPPTMAEIKTELEELCEAMEYLRSWWGASSEAVRDLLGGTTARLVHHYFIEGVTAARSVARVAGIAIDTNTIRDMNWYDSSRFSLPSPPEVGPPPPMRYVRSNLMIDDADDTFVYVKTAAGEIEQTLEQTLRNIDLIEEPGRTRILLTLPFIFDMLGAA